MRKSKRLKKPQLCHLSPSEAQEDSQDTTTTNSATTAHAVTSLPVPPRVKEGNPLKIDLILQVLFDQCPATTLKNCRRVCKQWRDLSLPAWRNKATLCLSKDWLPSEKGSPSIRDFLLYETGVNSVLMPNHLRRYLDEGKDLQLLKYPFRNFQIDTDIKYYTKIEAKPITEIARHLTLQKIQSDYPTLEAVLQKFHSLESLELRDCELRWHPGSTPFLSRNLKRFRISVFCDRIRLFSHYPGEKFFQNFPNLQHLSFEFRMDKSNLEQAQDALDVIKSIKQRSTEPFLSSLKDLEIINTPFTRQSDFFEEKFDTHFFHTLVQCDFPLERLALDLSFSGIKLKIQKGIRCLCRLLSCSRDSLKYLRTNFYFDMDTFIDGVLGDDCKEEKEIKRMLKGILKPIPEPETYILMEMKELKVANGIWGLYLLAHLSLPNLVKLTVEYGKLVRKVNILDYQVRLLKEKRLPKLESFELLDSHDIIPPTETMTVFADMMPNLCALSCPMDKQGFQIVCERFRGLKTLNILSAQSQCQCRCSQLDDETLTGIDIDVTKGKGSRSKSRQPNLTNLQSLTDLSISRNAAVFHDHSVMHGFLLLPRLYYLSVGFEKISDETKAELFGHVKGTVEIQEEERVDLIDSESDVDFIAEEESSDELDSFENYVEELLENSSPSESDHDSN